MHYINQHNYQPPASFLEAVSHCPKPGSPEYFKALRASGLDLIAFSMPARPSWAHLCKEWGRRWMSVKSALPPEAGNSTPSIFRMNRRSTKAEANP